MIYKENCLFFFKNDLRTESLDLYNQIPILDFMKHLRPTECLTSNLKDEEIKKIKMYMNEPEYYSIFIDGDHKILKILTGNNNGKIEQYGDKIK
jgi:hypothetical protein